MKKLKNVFLLHFVYEFEDGHDYVKLIGAFSSKEKAKKALLDIKKISKLKKIYKFFTIDKYTINRISWKEGFITVD